MPRFSQHISAVANVFLSFVSGMKASATQIVIGLVLILLLPTASRATAIYTFQATGTVTDATTGSSGPTDARAQLTIYTDAGNNTHFQIVLVNAITGNNLGDIS